MHESLELRMLHAPIVVVNHPRIRREFLLVLRIAGQELLEALALRVIGEPGVVGRKAGRVRRIRVLRKRGHGDREREDRA